MTVRVTDNGIPPLSDTGSFTIQVNEVNRPPTILPVPDQVVTAGDEVDRAHLGVTVDASGDLVKAYVALG